MFSISHGEGLNGHPSSSTRMQILSSQVWAALEREQRRVMGREILALLCPDWRQASMVLDARDGTIAYANWRCLQLLKSGEVIRAVGDRLDFCSRAQNLRFRNHLRDVASGVAECSHLVGRNPETDRPFLVTIHSSQGFLREALELCFAGTPDGASFVIADITVGADLPDPTAVDALASEFGLSRAETHLMQLFACGLALEEVAARRGVTVNTARQQMKAVLNKTNCDRQQDLMRLVFSLCPGRDSAPSPSAASSEAWRDFSSAMSRPAKPRRRR